MYKTVVAVGVVVQKGIVPSELLERLGMFAVLHQHAFISIFGSVEILGQFANVAYLKIHVRFVLPRQSRCMRRVI